MAIASQANVNLVWLQSNQTQAEILDWYYALLESRGIEVKTNRQVAKDEGFTDEDLAKVSEAMAAAY